MASLDSRDAFQLAVILAEWLVGRSDNRSVYESIRATDLDIDDRVLDSIAGRTASQAPTETTMTFYLGEAPDRQNPPDVAGLLSYIFDGQHWMDPAVYVMASQTIDYVGWAEIAVKEEAEKLGSNYRRAHALREMVSPYRQPRGTVVVGQQGFEFVTYAGFFDIVRRGQTRMLEGGFPIKRVQDLVVSTAGDAAFSVTGPTEIWGDNDIVLPIAYADLPPVPAAKPLLPKKLASKIKAAQERLRNLKYDVLSTLKYDVLSTEQRIREEAAELAKLDANPGAYAARRYPNHGVGSYPVQTHMGRLSENYTYRVSRLPVRRQRVIDSARELEQLGREVFTEVQHMRPSNGRVPWPKAPAD